MDPRRQARLRRDNVQMVAKLALVAVLMFGFGYALVPLYRHICEALGINVLSLSERQTAGFGRSGVDVANTQVDRSRTVTVEFDANARGPWDFKPAQAALQVHPGELVTVMYDFRNRQPRTMTAQAIPSYAPKQATAYFNKVECFCFNEYTLAPGESRQWPVTFVIDPKLPRDVTTITLSYTFFEVAGGKNSAAAQATEPRS
ncbi:cytochrome c oxidase assembly protein [Azohydromonas aeria]|uniref:cytochrome c oxidase assembly protein n=1 Tax=Azohydromonas aeria TaxID=2590212 RepID=UPI0012FAE02C|nr:cytochrome c oxidase assembly protein [Azohydromonas aeria]